MPGLAEGLEQQPGPDSLAYWLQPFKSYFERQGRLAREGLTQADQGAQQVRGGDFSGLAGMLLGPLGYAASPINALVPTESEVYNAPDLPESAKPLVAGGLGLAAMMLPGNKKGMAPAQRTLYHGTREEALNLTNDRPLYLTAQQAEARGYAEGQHLGGTGRGKPQVLSYEAKEGQALNIDDELFEAMDAGGDLDAVINAAAQRAKGQGYRYLEYTHPGFTPGQEQAVTVSLFPKDDLIGNAPEGITAYHGSPHTFDRFDINKIGSGEGAQAYGHGLYFAEKEAVARDYRNKLAAPASNFDDARTLTQTYLADAGGDLQKVRRVLEDSLANPQAHPTLRKRAQIVLDYLKANDVPTLPGSMYQVRLNVKPDELLDFDSPANADLAKKLGVESGSVALKDGMDLAGGGKLRILHNGPDDFAKYALEMSGKQFRLSPKDVKNLVGSGLEGKSLYQNLSTKMGGDVKATEALKAAGIKGIRYKDQGSRGAEGGTYNYVIFDDKLVDILKRYGIPITAGAGGAAIVSGQDMPAELAAQMGPES